jgi:hypothetical protein
MKPPLLPTEVLRRVLRVARFDGISLLGFAGGFALISAYSRDVSGALIGLLVAAAGAIELHGVGLIRSGRNGMRWLISSQFYLMSVMLAYSGYRLLRPDIAWLLPYMNGDAAEPIKEAAQQAGVTVEQMLVASVQLIYFCIAAATVLYQGGMIVYYAKRRIAVKAALEEPRQ